MSELVVEKREILGGKVKSLREKGFIPAELYGYGVENTHLSVPKASFADIYEEAGSNSIVDLMLSGERHKVLIHDVHMHPITREVLNIDFYKVNMREKITTQIPLEFVGESTAVSELGGVLLTVRDEVEVEALPTDLPQSIEVDLSKLVELDTSLTVADLPKSSDYEYVSELEAAVVTVSTPREEEEEEPTEEMSVEDVVVEGEDKEKEGESGSEENQNDDKAEA